MDIKPFHEQGRAYWHLSDPLRLSEHALLLPEHWGALLSFCNGKHDVQTINRLLRAQYGVTMSVAQTQEVINALDQACMLENDRSLAARRQAAAAFRNLPFRPPALAGGAYPAEPESLRRMLDNYLAAAKELPAAASDGTPTTYRGLLSPHIDYARGGAVYADVWQEAALAAQAADLVIIFGTDHYGNDPFTLTRQHYATPYGVLPTALPVVDALAETIGAEAAYAGELRHRNEHSLELVAIWLHHMRNGQPCAVVPILTGGFHHFIYNGAQPIHDTLIQDVLKTLAAHCQQRNVLIVASGDLAHVGPAFGGRALNAVSRERLQHDDEKLLAQMQQGDANGFFEEIRRVKDGNNVCGVSPIYLTMRLLEALNGSVRGAQVAYATCPADAQNTSVVTVGGVLFH
ncbi:MAG: AmmeMemoRadiSam system protein B [Caldilineaceae bacterium]